MSSAHLPRDCAKKNHSDMPFGGMATPKSLVSLLKEPALSNEAWGTMALETEVRKSRVAW